MTTESNPPGSAPLLINGKPVATSRIGEFLLADERRVNSFITNFGDWQLPASVAAALHSPVVHLEWFHDTGDLVAIGQIPHMGEGAVEVDSGVAVLDAVEAALPFGSPGRVVRSADGSVREFFAEMVVSEETLVAELAHIEHGPRVHELLWGWHGEHRKPEGWSWLEKKLGELGNHSR